MSPGLRASISLRLLLQLQQLKAASHEQTKHLQGYLHRVLLEQRPAVLLQRLVWGWDSARHGITPEPAYETPQQDIHSKITAMGNCRPATLIWHKIRIKCLKKIWIYQEKRFWICQPLIALLYRNELIRRTDHREDWTAIIADVCNRPGTWRWCWWYRNLY